MGYERLFVLSSWKVRDPKRSVAALTERLLKPNNCCWQRMGGRWFLEAAFWSGSCIKYWPNRNQGSVETWLQANKRAQQRKTLGKRRLPQEENAQSHICQNPYGPRWGKKLRRLPKRVESPAAEAEKIALLMTCDIRIGTSGYHYKHWRGPFYPAEISPNEMLAFYSQKFDTVELNNSFYRLPTEVAFDNWRQSTPADFVFAVKASRFLTHQKKLKDPESALQNFLPRASRLSTKLGPLLFQLPPRWQVNPGRLEGLLEALPRDLRCTFEFRDLSWIRPDINKLLSRFGAAFCIYELAGYHSPLTVTADFAYVRLHGPGLGKYQESYSTGRLRRWSKQVEDWAKDLASIYIYFDNDQAGYAARNASELKRLVSGKDGRGEKKHVA